MSRLVAYAFTALIAASPSLACAAEPAQQPSAQPHPQMHEPRAQRMLEMQAAAEPADLTDLRIEVVRNALQLTPEQMKYWPAVEDAIRARAESRRQRLEKRAMGMQEGRFDDNFVRVLQNRAEALYERAAGLNKLATAWQPLYATLDEAQKRRMRILAIVALHRIREGIEARREAMEMEDEGAFEAITGPSGGESGMARE